MEKRHAVVLDSECWSNSYDCGLLLGASRHNFYCVTEGLPSSVILLSLSILSLMLNLNGLICADEPLSNYSHSDVKVSSPQDGICQNRFQEDFWGVFLNDFTPNRDQLRLL